MPRSPPGQIVTTNIVIRETQSMYIVVFVFVLIYLSYLTWFGGIT